MSAIAPQLSCDASPCVPNDRGMQRPAAERAMSCGTSLAGLSPVPARLVSRDG